MSEPTRTSAAQRAKLATALKRNMARRKAASEVSAIAPTGYRVASHGEPLAPNSARGQQAEPAMSCDSTPHGEVSRPSQRQ